MNYFQLFFMLIIREIWLIICLELILIILFFDLGILSQTFTIHRTAGQWKIYLFNSSVPLSPASQTLRHQPGSYCREHTSAHSQQPYTNQKPLISELKLITTKLHALTLIYSFYELFPAFICAYNTRSLVNSLFGVNIYNSFFYLGILSQTFTIHMIAGQRESISLTPLYHFHRLHRHLRISQALLQTAHLCTQLAAVLEPETFDFSAEVDNH